VLGAFVWGIAEATLFFLVPDVLLSLLGVRLGARVAAAGAAAAALGASAGGAAMYLWSAHDPTAARVAVLAVPAVSEALWAAAERAMAQDWFTATLLGPLTATPFKVYASLAPHAGVGLAAFVLASLAARLPRFLLTALGAAWIRARLERRVGTRALAWTMSGAWVLFYAAFFALMPW
jgi:hypothetical protein